MIIEQVVFAWSDAEGRPAARVLGCTAAIHSADLKELAAWGHEHDATLSKTPGAIRYDCHPLASGAVCVGRTGVYCLPTHGRQRETDERSLALYTHCLLISPDDALRHARHFPLILRAAENGGAFRHGAEPPEKMEPLSLEHFDIAGASGGAESLLAPPIPSPKTGTNKTSATAAPAASPASDESPSNSAALRQAHAPHRGILGSAGAAESDSPPVENASPLDAAFDAAIKGREAAIAELASLWTAAERDFDANTLDESRERYLRRAASVWTDYLNNAHDAGQSMASIEVLCLLLEH